MKLNAFVRNAWSSMAMMGARALARSSGNWEDPTKPINFQELHEVWGTADSCAVSHKTALGYAPLYQAVSMISGDCAKIPLNVYEKTKTGRSVASDHAVQGLIHRYAKPNPELNGYKFWKRFYAFALLWGNSYAWIDRNNRGDVIGLYHLLPDRTWMERLNGQLICRTQTKAGTRNLNPDDVLHIDGLSIDGMQGMNVIETFRKDFTIALAAKDFQVRFFKNNMSAGGVLQARPGVKPEAIRKMQKRIEENFSGSDKAFKTLVLRDNFQWFSTQVDPQKAQLTETKEEQARDVARMYNIPPSKLGLKDSTSYNSEEMAKQNYHDGALSHLLLSAACESTTKLLTDSERQKGLYIEHNINALLWADGLTRAVIANSGIASGRYSPNETRAWENSDGYDGGDTYYVPMNVQPVGTRRTKRSARRKQYNERMRNEAKLLRATRELHTEAARQLATQAFNRAINRASIKLERSKTLESDKAGIVEIVDTTMRQIGVLLNRDCSDVAEKWFASISALDSASLRAQAESSYQSILNELLKGPDDAGK